MIPPINWIKTAFGVCSYKFLISRVNNVIVNGNEFFLSDFDKDGYEGEYEGTEHYGQQQYYSGEETFHDTPDHGENRFLQETDSKDGVDYNTGADDETIYGSQERYDHDEHHGVTTRSKGNACQHLFLIEQQKERFGFIRSSCVSLICMIVAFLIARKISGTKAKGEDLSSTLRR